MKKNKIANKEKIEEVYEKIKNLKKQKLFLIEDPKTLEIAIDYKLKPIVIFVTEKILSENIQLFSSSDMIEDKIYIISDKKLKKLKQVKTNPGIIALFKKREKFKEKSKKNAYFIALDRVQDPGNVGTIIRSALNFGVSRILLSSGSASIYNPKVVRGSMGTVMIQHIEEKVNLEKRISELKENGFGVYLTSSTIGKRIDKIKPVFPSIFVFGNESRGVSKEIEKFANHWIRIPTTQKTDSLNVSISASIIMYELFKRTT